MKTSRERPEHEEHGRVPGGPENKRPAGPDDRARPAKGRASAMAGLQQSAGNRAVAGLLAQRTSAGKKPSEPQAVPAEGVPEAVEVQRLARPDGGRKLAALKSEVRGKQKVLSAHQPASTAAGAAQQAAKPPADDKLAQGKAANAEQMNAAKPGVFDKAAFIAAVNQAIAAQAPKNLDEADKFSESGKADAVKGEVQGKVTAGKKASAGQIEQATTAPPDTSAAKEKTVTPLRPAQPAAAPGALNAENAVPDKAPASATDFSAGPAQVDAQMADAQVTDQQLATSNEPDFTGALQDKKAGEQHAATAPAQVRGKENQTLSAAKAHAVAQGGAAMQGMASANKTTVDAVAGGQHGTQSSDEAKRAQVTAKLQTVFDATQKDVEAILAGLDKKVDDAFTVGEKRVRDAFTADHQRRMDAYKDKRYSGFTGKLRWVKDKFAGLPAEANQIFTTARQGYVSGMQGVISSVADLIGGELNRAKQRIAAGRSQLQAEVGKLPKDLQALGKQAAGEFGGKFDELTSSVDAKGQELVQTLATKYNDALKSVDAEIDAEKDKNKGLIDKAKDAIGGVIKTILQLKDLLLGVLAKAASAVMAILKDPIGFLGHLVSAVGAGLRNFMANLGEHLKKGLLSWLLGAMASAGLQLPAKFDLRGILGMIGSLLGLTWGAIRGRIVQRGIPEQAMGAVEAGVPLVGKLQNEGVAGVEEEIKEQVGDLKSNLFGKITEYLLPTVLIAGITWIISLLNPASAFVKAVKMIIDIVTFIIDRGAQIIEFVNSVLDAIIAIAGGGGGGVPALIEKALAASIPVLIGALAAILNVGSVADKVKSFFTSLTKPVMKAVDWVVDKIVKLGKGIWARLRGKDKNKATDPTTKDPAKERAAIADADRMLATAPRHDAAAKQVSALSQRHGVPLRLVSETTDTAGEHVHVQTMATESHVLPGVDPAKQQRIDELKTEFVALVNGLGGDGGKAAAVATYTAGHGSPDDFIREMEQRAIKVVKVARQAPEIVKADLQKAGLDFALRRQGTAGAPGEFANVFEYYMTLWIDKRAAALAKINADFAAGLRPQPTKRELKEGSARMALDELLGSPNAATSAYHRDRASVEALQKPGVTADPALTDEELVAHIRAQASQLTFGTTTGAAYHSRAHRNEIPEARREARGFIANYHAAAERAVKEGRAQFFPVLGGDSRQVRFIVETTDDNGDPVTLTAMVYARADGRVTLATFGSFLKN